MKNKLLYILLLLGLCGQEVSAAGIDGPARREIGRTLTRIVAREVSGGYVRIEGVDASRKRVRIYTSVGPFVLSVPRREPARHARLGAPAPASGVPQGGHRTLLRQAGGRRADSDGLPNRGGIPETFAQEEDRALYQPLRAAAGDPFFGAVVPSQGLAGRHIALWQSHGRYFDQPQNRWKWQRSQLWQTCEDLYTQSYVLPYLVPMLENAGACVMLPRERDVQKYEILADNDAAGAVPRGGGT